MRLPRRAKRRAGELEAATMVRRLAVLLEAGVTPALAWRHLEGSVGGHSAIVRIATAAAAEGSDIGTALRAAAPMVSVESEAAAWRAVAAAWQVAATVGAPLAPTLRAVAETLRSGAAHRREVDVALAGPKATSRLVSAMPLVAVAFGAVLGLGTVSTLLSTPAGWACLVTGAGLLAAGWRWSAVLVRRATPVRAFPGLRHDLMAIALRGGVSIARARVIVDDALGFGERGAAPVLADADADADAAALVADELVERRAVDDVITFAEGAGVPAAELLRAEADEQRRRSADDARERIGRLGITLLLPLGVCTLPAFMLLGVVPVLLSVLSSTVWGF